jgi:AraC-like DNA-binding protein
MVYGNIATLIDELPTEQSQEIHRFLSSQNIFTLTLEYIENHLGDNLTNEQLADIAHMSESHFSHRFKELLHQTPARYVLDRRIASAAQKLIFTDISIDQIASNIGFTNRFHFSRNFKTIMGITPAAYRKTKQV